MRIDNGNWKLKKIYKSPPPNELTNFADAHPDDSWKSFTDYNASNDYKSLKRKVFDSQQELCAYCEIKIPHENSHKQRIEHFHPKRDSETSGRNWDLDWTNVFGVCKGGSETPKSFKPREDHLHCDAIKEIRIKCCNVEGQILNPLLLEPFPNLFIFEKSSGKLLPNKEACSSITFIDNQFDSTYELLNNTIDKLNLNCHKLNTQRLEVLRVFNAKLKRARLSNDREWRLKLANQWFREPWPQYFTTRRCLLGSAAEERLIEIDYDG